MTRSVGNRSGSNNPGTAPGAQQTTVPPEIRRSETNGVRNNSSQPTSSYQAGRADMMTNQVLIADAR